MRAMGARKIPLVALLVVAGIIVTVAVVVLRPSGGLPAGGSQPGSENTGSENISAKDPRDVLLGAGEMGLTLIDEQSYTRENAYHAGQVDLQSGCSRWFSSSDHSLEVNLVAERYSSAAAAENQFSGWKSFLDNSGAHPEEMNVASVAGPAVGDESGWWSIDFSPENCTGQVILVFRKQNFFFCASRFYIASLDTYGFYRAPLDSILDEMACWALTMESRV